MSEIDPEKVRDMMLDAVRGLSTGTGRLQKRMAAFGRARRQMEAFQEVFVKNNHVLNELVSTLNYRYHIVYERKQAQIWFEKYINDTEQELRDRGLNI